MGGRVIVMGAGLTGLSASLHLPPEWEVEVLEREAEVGGVCRTIRVDGFSFDYTGHLLHLRDPHVKDLVARLLPGAFRECERHAAIWSHGALLPYPFQANLHGLPPEVVAECLLGAVEAHAAARPAQEATSFADWSERVFGRGIARHFMIPYNAKLYACDLEEVLTDFVSWSVPRPSLEQVVRGALGLRNEGLGYNPTFLYPLAGGIDPLARALGDVARGVRLRTPVARVDLARRVVVTEAGEERPWDRLVSTLPLKTLVRIADPLPSWAKEAALGLRAVAVVGFNFGLDRAGAGSHDWVYVPEPEYPFYRVGFPSSFSPESCPPGASSLYVEVSLREGERPDLDELEESVMLGLRRMGVVRESDRVLARSRVLIDPAYVIPDRHRREWRDRLLDVLLEHDVQSVGRYGAWTYSSMEDALLAGRQAADAVAGLADPRARRAGDR